MKRLALVVVGLGASSVAFAQASHPVDVQVDASMGIMVVSGPMNLWIQAPPPGMPYQDSMHQSSMIAFTTSGYELSVSVQLDRDPAMDGLRIYANGMGSSCGMPNGGSVGPWFTQVFMLSGGGCAEPGASVDWWASVDTMMAPVMAGNHSYTATYTYF